MREKSTPVDVAAAEIAAEQHGVISILQLRAVGISDEAVRRRVEAGRLHRLHRGVYAVGHTADSWRKRWMAAVLAGGEGAVLSHMSAAALWGLLRAEEGPVDISVPHRSSRKRREGIRVHRSRSLVATVMTHRHRIPVTTPARTISDLDGTVPSHWVRRAIRQAELAGFDLGDLAGDGTRSDLELDFLRICRRAGLPAPEVNVKVGRWIVDFLWRAERLAVETDSYRYHRGHIAFQDDHARELDLHRRGFAVRRFDERQIDEEPAEVASDIAAALSIEWPGWPTHPSSS